MTPFGGSGTTLAACEAYGQPSYTMELTPAFTDVIVKRYIRITGKQNVRCVRQGRELSRGRSPGSSALTRKEVDRSDALT